MELGNYISEQLAMFVRAILLGASLGLVYDLFRTLRRLGGRVWGGVLDGTYCVLAVCSLFLFVMAGDGEMRLFVPAGALGGAVLFFCLLSRPLRPLGDFWLEVFLSPVRAAAGVGKKGGRRAKKLFSFSRRWVTINVLYPLKRRRPQAQKEEEQMENRSEKRGGKQPPAQKKRPNSRLTLWLLALLLAGFGIQLYSLYSRLQTARQEEAVYAQQLEELREENQRLRSDIENSGDLTLMGDIAREELGYVGPGEKVFQFGKG